MTSCSAREKEGQTTKGAILFAAVRICISPQLSSLNYYIVYDIVLVIGEAGLNELGILSLLVGDSPILAISFEKNRKE